MKRILAVYVGSVLILAVGCGDDAPQVGARAPVAPTAAAPAGQPVAPAQVPGQPVSDADAGVVDTVLEYRDDEFVENEGNRDPFRSFEALFQIKPPEAPAREVKIGNTSVEQMRVIAIISGVAQARAMIVDTEGVGHTVERGDYLGRPEVMQSGGAEGMTVALNWRVARIYPNEVVLTRDDPTAPNRPPLTRRMPLHEEGEAQR